MKWKRTENDANEGEDEELGYHKEREVACDDGTVEPGARQGTLIPGERAHDAGQHVSENSHDGRGEHTRNEGEDGRGRLGPRLEERDVGGELRCGGWFDQSSFLRM